MESREEEFTRTLRPDFEEPYNQPLQLSHVLSCAPRGKWVNESSGENDWTYIQVHQRPGGLPSWPRD